MHTCGYRLHRTIFHVIWVKINALSGFRNAPVLCISPVTIYNPASSISSSPRKRGALKWSFNLIKRSYLPDAWSGSARGWCKTIHLKETNTPKLFDVCRGGRYHTRDAVFLDIPRGLLCTARQSVECFAVSGSIYRCTEFHKFGEKRPLSP